MPETLDDRIAQFRKMANDDPGNDMAHYSLGAALLQAGLAADAASCFERCIALNPVMSKAYQLAGQSLIQAGQNDHAVKVLNQGFTIASQRGDRMPQSAIADLLKSIGKEPPTVVAISTPTDASSGTFVCRRTGKPGTRMPGPPMRGPLGKWIEDNISSETWKTWIGQGTKVINELRLDFSRDQDQETYDRYMREFLGIDDALHDEIRAAVKSA